MDRYRHLSLETTAAEIPHEGDTLVDVDIYEIGGYKIEGTLGAGGLGRVMKARSREGRSVALKLLSLRASRARDRFAREIDILGALSHPAIVRYIDHGTSVTGDPFLVMEWLDGVDLRSRVRQRPLTVAETLALGVRLASALSEVHERGVIHRDIKPSNIVLPGGDLQHAKIIDFGVAHLPEATDVLTSVGEVIGTPSYMSPEQVRGAVRLTPSSDIYSLGCVLYECLTGEPPFVADHPIAVLCKTLFQEVPAPSDLAPRVPPAVDELLLRFLDKEPGNRPKDGAAATLALEEALRSSSDEDASWHTLPADAITSDEQRLINVVVLAGGTSEAESQGPTRELEVLSSAALTAGARVEALRDGTLIAVLDSWGVATDQAVTAARLALVWSLSQPQVPMAMATGRAVTGRSRLVGEVIERAITLMTGATGDHEHVHIDPLSAGLLGDRFEVHEADGEFELRGERNEHLQAARGDASTPFVGREHELSKLCSVLEEGVEDAVAQTVLITGEPGLGKSRLLREFVKRARRDHPSLGVWMGVGDPVRHSPLSALAALLRNAFGIRPGASAGERRQKLRAHLARYLPEAERARAGAFIGELLETPIVRLDHAELRSARHDPLLMNQHIRRVCELVLEGALAQHPVLIAIDDLQWVDAATLQLIDKMLQTLSERPLMLVALRRPGDRQDIDDLGTQYGKTELILSGLSRRAARKLLRSMVEESSSDQRLHELIKHARGNPFYLQELVYSHLDDQSRFPDTVLALVQARIDALESRARRLLRAASVFGQVFWDGGVSALLGNRQQAREWMEHLCRQGLISPCDASRFVGERQYEFRHGLIREGAYAMLTEHDRRLAHRLAATWLRDHGEKDSSVLAEHFELGGQPDVAVSFYLQAAEDALETGGLDAALDMAEHGIACGATGRLLGMLYGVRVDVYRWKGDNNESAETCARALELLPRGSRRWFEVAGESAGSWGRIDHWHRVESLAGYLCAGPKPNDDRIGWIIASTQVASQLILGQLARPGFELLAAVDEEVQDIDKLPPLAAGKLQLARATRVLVNEHGPASMLQVLEDCAASFERAGDMRQACLHRSNVGYAKMQIGLYQEAANDLRAALAIADPMELERAAYSARNNLGLALAHCGQLREARQAEEQAVQWYTSRGESRMIAGSHIYLARILLLDDDPRGAEKAARVAVSILPERAPLKPHAQALLGAALLALEQRDEALEHAVAAMESLEELGAVEEGASMIRLVHARALHAVGRYVEARTAIAHARGCLLELAETIDNLEWRNSFLENIPEHVQILRLAQEWQA